MIKNKRLSGFMLVVMALIFALTISSALNAGKSVYDVFAGDTFKILSSTENKDIEPVIRKYFNDKKIKVSIDYAGTIEIMDKMNNNEDYNAIWASNSIWLYMLNDPSKIIDSKSTLINPVVFGIKKSIAEDLGFTSKEVYTKDILDAIKDKKEICVHVQMLNFYLEEALKKDLINDKKFISYTGHLLELDKMVRSWFKYEEIK